MAMCSLMRLITVIADSLVVGRVLVGAQFTADYLRSVHLEHHKSFALAKMLRKGNSVSRRHCNFHIFSF